MVNNKTIYIRVWLMVFFYILLVGFLIQFVVLPVFFPDFHAGDGLLISGDWNGYHRIALDLTAEMELQGWSAWQLRPSDQAPAGIGAAIYTLTGITKPWTFLPLNAISHATSAILLLLIICSVTGRLKPSVWPVLPFIFFPTALLWNSQFHKDSFFILGSYLILFGLLQLTQIDEHKYLWRLFRGFTLLVAGILLIWVIRPYGVEMVFYIGIVLAFVATLYLLAIFRKNRKVLINIAIIWLALYMASPLTGTGVHHQYVELDYFELEESEDNASQKQLPAGETTIEYTPKQKTAHLSDAAEEVEKQGGQTNYEDKKTWRHSTILPSFFDENIYKMSIMRDRYLTHKPEAGSNIDLEVRFSSAGDAIKYIPRALHIGLFAPFPGQWFAEGTSIVTTLMRRVSAFEMMLVYAALFCLLISCWLWRKNLQLYLVLGFPLGMIIVYALVVANVGTLHRMRYGFLMTLVALGIAGLLEFITKRNEQKRI